MAVGGEHPGYDCRVPSLVAPSREFWWVALLSGGDGFLDIVAAESALPLA